MKLILILSLSFCSFCFGQNQLKKSEFLSKFNEYIKEETFERKSCCSFLNNEALLSQRIFVSQYYQETIEPLLDDYGEPIVGADTAIYSKIHFIVDESFAPKIKKLGWTQQNSEIGRSGMILLKSKRYIYGEIGSEFGIVDCELFDLIFNYSCHSGKIEDLYFEFDHVSPQIPKDWKVVNNKIVIVDK